MELILITGLDGSGKSTILNALEKRSRKSTFGVLHVPHIDSESISHDIKLKKVAAFVNAISLEADFLKIPQLKAIAIFSSMLLFKKLVEYKTTPGLTHIYCERHPLIDTGIYARFYAERMGKGRIDDTLLQRIDQAYSAEIDYLIRLIPAKLIPDKGRNIEALTDFITKWFFIEGRLDIKELKKLFNLELPAKIYYLRASPEILIHRLAARTIHEAHETVEVLEKLSAAYDKLFDELSAEYPSIVERIDAGNANTLNYLQDKLT
jgi:thymidylate kinase